MNATLWGFVRKETVQAMRDKRMRMVLFVMPMIQLAVFGLAISTEVKGVKLKVESAPSDVLARRIEERCLASGWFVRAKVSGNDPVEWVQSGGADAVAIVPPGGLTRAFNQGEGRLQVLVDATNAVRARSIERYLGAIVRQVTDEASPAGKAPEPLALDVRVLYNPSMETAIFMVPGVMCMILAVLTIVLTSMSMAKEKELGTFETLIAAPVRSREILLGKTLPYVLLGMLDVFLILAVAVFLFGVPVRGQIWELAFAAFVFICSTVGIGTLISTYAGNQQQAMMGAFLFLYPAILLSGIMFPIDNMPQALRGIAYLNPLMYLVTLLRNILLKGGDLTVLLKNTGALALIGIAAVWLTAKRFKQTLN